MREIIEAIPSVEVFLALEPEELAEYVLRAVAARGDRRPMERHFNRGNLASEFTYHGTTDLQYPSQYWPEVRLAFTEAFVWLEAAGLVIPNPESDSWSVLSRRAKQVLEQDAFEEFRAVRHFPKNLVHPSIRDSVWRLYIRGEFAGAVFHAMRAVEIAVRERGGFDEKDHGVVLMRKAFDKSNGRLTDMSAHEGEREALANLFAGAIGSYKNPHSHRNVPLDEPTEATEMIMLASHLLRIVEARTASDQALESRD